MKEPMSIDITRLPNYAQQIKDKVYQKIHFDMNYDQRTGLAGFFFVGSDIDQLRIHTERKIRELTHD